MFVSACDLVHRFLDMASQSVYIILYRLIYNISYYVLSIVSSSQLSGHGIPVRSEPQFDSALTLVTHCIALLPRGVGGHVTPRLGFVLLVFVFCSYFYPLCITLASARGQITPHIGLQQILIPKKWSTERKALKLRKATWHSCSCGSSYCFPFLLAFTRYAVAGRAQDWAEIDTFNVQSSMEILHI